MLANFSLEIIITLLIIALGVFFFVKEVFRIDTTSILIMTLFIVTGILAPEEGFRGFNHPATITIGCMFVLSAGIFKTGLLNGVSRLLIKVGKKSYVLALVAIVIISGGLSAFINDTAVVALLMPVVVEMAKRTGMAPSKLLMPLSFGALLGGVCTLIGTSTNILVSGIAQQHDIEPFGMFEFSGAAIWLMLAGIAYLILAGMLGLLPNRKGKVAEEFKESSGSYVTEVSLLADAPGLGKSISDSDLLKKYDFKILQVNRGERMFRAYPNTHLQEGDVLKILVSPEVLQQMREVEGIKIQSDREFDADAIESDLEQMYEVLVPTNSKLAGSTLDELSFQSRYDSTVLAIRSRKGVLVKFFNKLKLKEGDLLLLLGQKISLQRLQEEGDLIVISTLEEGKFRYKKAIPALIIVIGVVLTASLNVAPIIITAMVGALLMVVLQVIKPQEAYQAIDWKVIFMLAGVLSMSTALEKTGGADLLSGGIFHLLKDFDPRFVLSAIFFITFVATNFMSNNASAALMAPIVISLAQSLEISERPFLVAVMFAASLSFMTPMSYQTNTMIMTPGNYKFSDYLKVGTPLNIIMWIIATFVIPLYFPF